MPPLPFLNETLCATAASDWQAAPVLRESRFRCHSPALTGEGV